MKPVTQYSTADLLTTQPQELVQLPTPQTTESHELKVAQAKYQYTYSNFSPLPMVKRLPIEEMPTMSWWRKVIAVMVSLLVNAAVARHGHSEQEAHEYVSGLFRQSLFAILQHARLSVRLKVLWHLLKITPKLLLNGFKMRLHHFEDLATSLLMEFEHDIIRLLHLGVKDQVNENKPHPTEDTPDCLKVYDQLFATIERPAIANYFAEDANFANCRVAGPNPLMIERAKPELFNKFPVTNEQYQAVMGPSDSLEQALQDGRLYVADYFALEGALNGTYPDCQKYIDAPIALFAVPQEGAESRNLQPVAIQCRQTPAANNPIFIPKPEGLKEEQYAWDMAKRVVQIADTNYHEAVTHLGRTHLFISPFVMSTHRQLPKTHPISILLRPHFEGTLSINNGANAMLMANQGGVDTVLAATIDCSRALAAVGVQSYGFNRAMLPAQLEARGLADRDVLPNYPYRDDALLLWDAIETWVSDYVGLYYTTDQAVEKDVALQRWATELQAFDGGRVPEFGEQGQLRTCRYLIQALTLIIFTASAQHAAVNFPQGDMMNYPPAMPLAGYTPSPTQTEMSYEAHLDQLPTIHQALEQMELTYLLGQVYHTQLGEYGEYYFQDERVAPALNLFQARLKEIEAEIDLRNGDRLYPYAYLKPSKIPQSINI